VIIAIVVIMAVAAVVIVKSLIAAEFEIEDELQVRPWRYQEGDDDKE